MIVHPARHLFEAKYPTLEDHEEEIFYQHPTQDIKCNQLGVIYYNESIFSIYDKRGTSIVRITKTGLSFGSKTKVIYECYTGQTVSSPHFFFANGNPLDTRKENLVMSGPLSGKEREPYLRTKNRFIKASVEHLIKLETKMQAVGVGRHELHELLLLPQWLKAARERYVAPVAKFSTRKSCKGTPKVRTTKAEADEVERLFHLGLTFYGIIQRMGWVSTSRIKKIIKERGLVR